MRQARAFTLVELLAAMVLASLLLAALLAVTRSIMRSQRALDRLEQHDQWRHRLVELIRSDLAASDEAEMNGNRLILRGLCAIDPARLEPTHHPATVVYELVRLQDQRDWLVRRQSRSDLPSSRDWAQALCPDVKSFALQPLRRGSETTAAPPAQSWKTSQLTAVYELTIRPSDPAIEPIRGRVVLR